MGSAIQALGRTAEQRFEDHQMPVNLKQHYILVFIGQTEEVFQTALADVMRRDKSAILRQIDSLESLGLLARENDSLDRRKKLLVLTERGREVRERGMGLVTDVMRELMAGVTPEELEVFQRVLGKMIHNSDPNHMLLKDCPAD